MFDQKISPNDQKSIIFLKKELSPKGGLEKYAKILIEAFSKKGFNPTILTSSINPSINCHSIPHSWGPKFFKIHSFDKSCQQFIKKHPHSIIFGLDQNSFQTHLRAGNGSHLAYLESRALSEGFTKTLLCKINPLHLTLLSMEKKAFEHPELKTLFTNSLMVKNQILNRYNTPEEKIKVIHNGVEWEKMDKEFSLWEEKKKHNLLDRGLNPNAFQLLFIGHNYVRKGLYPLLQALSHFKNKEFELSVIGKDKNIGYFKHLCKKWNLEKKVHFFGVRSDIISFYQCADALAIPSFYDPFANVTIEALAMGLFVISSSSNGGSEILTPNTGAIIYNLKNQDELIEALKIAFSHPKTKKSSIEIRNSVEQFDFHNQISKIIEATIHV